MSVISFCVCVHFCAVVRNVAVGGWLIYPYWPPSTLLDGSWLSCLIFVKIFVKIFIDETWQYSFQILQSFVFKTHSFCQKLLSNLILLITYLFLYLSTFIRWKIENNSPWVNFTHSLEKRHLLTLELVFISTRWRVYMHIICDI